MKIGARYIKAIKAVLLVSMLVLLWQYVKAIDPHQVQAVLMKVGTGFGWVILSTFVAYALGTLGWWFCLGDAKKGIPKSDLFMIRHVCETVSLFNPASIAGGDMLKIVLLRPYAVSQPAVLTSVVVSRLLMIVSQILLLVFTILWFALSGKLQISAWLPGKSIFLVVVICLSLFLIIYKISGLNFDAAKNPKLARIQKKLGSLRSEVNRFYHTHPKELAFAMLFFTLHWIVGSMEFYIVLKLFGFDVTIIDGLLLDMGVIAVKSAGAFVPGQIGVEELGNKIMLSLIGISSIPLWLSVSALRRTRQLFWIVVGAAFYSFFIYKKRLYS
ncbi:lysylphosphatidylglycerol synthase transmembrane domain-containing protein [Dyadobacter sp. CY326]|uniref:lysylphosphatidylglycerol synthase transmembrane domain-containing protein n=1 Tax=Dyadobacter sp. CY326 TaxID=2907300 RepID=UPI001F2489C2|nr:lysylphosphatidylglycerol synthase transmembrane domain-containing protein [Dyadobacter sp. CY326]MCE7067004.1 flippase-like domain-containing protein [Dyadobacter sp. CY326]